MNDRPLTSEQQRLVEQYLPLVGRISAGWRARCRTTIDHAELQQAGALGLVEAVRRFDPERRDTFARMAAERIRGAICDHLRSLDPLSRGRRRAVRELDSALQQLRTELGREPESEDLARVLGWDEDSVDDARSDAAALARGWAVTREAPDPEQAGGTVFRDEDEPTPFDELLRSEMAGELRDAIESLPERDRVLLDLYYREELTMKEIGEVLDVTESRVSQLHTAAVGRLRKRMTRRLAATA